MINPLAIIRDLWSLRKFTKQKAVPCLNCGEECYPECLYDGYCCTCFLVGVYESKREAP